MARSGFRSENESRRALGGAKQIVDAPLSPGSPEGTRLARYSPVAASVRTRGPRCYPLRRGSSEPFYGFANRGVSPGATSVSLVLRENAGARGNGGATPRKGSVEAEDSFALAHFGLGGFQLRRGTVRELIRQRRDGIGPAILMGIGIQAECANVLEFFQALVKLLARLKLQREIPFRKERTASIAATRVAGQERHSRNGKCRKEECSDRLCNSRTNSGALSVLVVHSFHAC